MQYGRPRSPKKNTVPGNRRRKATETSAGPVGAVDSHVETVEDFCLEILDPLLESEEEKGKA